MSITKEQARQEVTKLVAKYQNLTAPIIKKYTEADTRRTFIEPLFQALGWDVYSREEVAEEVKASIGRVDYVFKLHGVSQFYLEAKALRAELTKPEYVKQAITYAYNKGITWAVLTDFEGLQLYNAQTGHLFINLSYDNYLRDFDDLWLLSRESLESNALNEKAEKYGALPPRLGVEQRLFNQLRQWREELFTQLYHYNPDQTFNQIDEVIQRLFNRLIFIRTCEDRRIEDRVLLGAVHEWRSREHGGELIEVLRRIFRDFDGYYDSDLFAPHLVDQVFIESTTIEGIINGLYEIAGDMANYDFSLIDADVLGAVYEQYLGHVATVVKQRAQKAQIRMDLGYPSEPTFELTAKKQRRKEHGIYYTPRFITNYIVKETVGRFLKERSYNEILNIKILDPACGSGSFLIRAYDELLSYHAYRSGKSISELDQYERLPILIKNIFGVDLDMQAVEIARLNLLLRSLAKRETLPSLADNIRQGNSLISGTEDELKGYFGDNWQGKKPFNWEQEFKDIMADGGFDVVIGNPPYVSIYKISAQPEEKQFFTDHYGAAHMKFDLYVLFTERALSLLKNGGLFGFIVPGNFMVAPYGKSIRRIILNNCKILQIVNLMEFKIFAEAENTPIILILKKERAGRKRRGNKVGVVYPEDDPNKVNRIVGEPRYIAQKNLSSSPDYVFLLELTEEDKRILDHIGQVSIPFGEICYISRGLTLGANYWQKYTSYQDEKRFLKKFIKGRNVKRYFIEYTGENIVYKKDILTSPFFPELFESRKIIVPKIRESVQAGLDSVGYYIDSTGICCLPYASISSQRKVVPEKLGRSGLYALEYILACINSPIVNFYFQKHFPNANVVPDIIRTFPIRRIDFDNPTEKKMHDDLVALVDRMLELNKRLASIRNTPCNKRDELLREINRTDKEIDNLVYDLYELTAEERKIVEGG